MAEIHKEANFAKILFLVTHCYKKLNSIIRKNFMYKVLLLSCLFLAYHSIETKAQTRLTNPKVQVISPENISQRAPATPYITIVQHRLMPSPWVVLTPTEFQALSQEAQQRALEAPDKHIVTEENKELVVKSLQDGKKVANLLLQQPIKK